MPTLFYYYYPLEPRAVTDCSLWAIICTKQRDESYVKFHMTNRHYSVQFPGTIWN